MRAKANIPFALLLLLLLGPSAASAQVFFSLRPDYLRGKTERFPLAQPFAAQYPDTSIENFHDYFPRNFLGNIGLPSPRYLLDFGSPDLGFIVFRPPYTHDRFFPRNITYHQSAGPFASLTGIAGSRELQVFKAFFTQTYRNGINVALSFRRYTSEGFYRRQQTYSNNFFLSSNYHQPGKRFAYYFFLLNNSNKNNENGGIRDAVLTDSTMLLQKELLPVRLTAADRDNRNTVVMANPSFRIARARDSAQRFTLTADLRSSYSGSLFRYTDAGIARDNFYGNIYNDSVRTRDSTRHRQLSNEAGLIVQAPGGGASFRAAVRHEYNHFFQAGAQNFSNQFVVTEFFSGNATDSGAMRQLAARLQYAVAGRNGGNYKAEAAAAWSTSAGRWKVFANALTESRNADEIYQRWRSNHFVWDHAFRPQQLTQVEAGLRLKRWLQVSGLFENFYNYLYFDELAMPAQLPAGEAVQNLGLIVRAEASIGRNLGAAAQYRFQSATRAVVRLPQQHVFARLFYKAHLFRNHLQLQLGAQAEIYDGFSPYAYMPATQAFFLQSSSLTSRYPYMDIYMNARIRPVTVFFKLENALHGFSHPGYFMVPGYYQPDRAFRFGLNWMFFD